MKDIFSNYPTSSSLLCNYPVESIPNYAVDEEACVMGDAPRISEIQKHYKDDCMVGWLGSMLDFFMKASNIREASNVQLGMTIQIIISKYGALKITEMMLFGFKFLSGDYEKFYGSFDTQAITRSLAEFVKYRNNIIQRCEIRNGQGKEQRNMGKENYLVYLTELQKAVYGNKESREYLRIRDDRELAMSVAMCVKRGDFPEKMLENINPEYNGMVEIILNKEGWEKVFSDRRAQNLGRLREIMNDQNKPLEDRVTAQQRLVYGEQYDAMRMLLYGRGGK